MNYVELEERRGRRRNDVMSIVTRFLIYFNFILLNK